MPKMLILYHSQEYGNTDKMARAIADGAKEAGIEPSLVNTNLDRMNVDDYRQYDVVAFGSPDYYSYIAGGLKMFLDDWYIAKKKDPQGLVDKTYGVFYSHGGGGAVRKVLEKLLARMGTQVGDVVESIGSPGDKELENCRLLGRQLAESAQ
ncbi:MAG: flavodoxin family protein [Candidatus Sumerlaeia bacterium]